MKMKQIIREKYNYDLGHIEFYVAGRTASWKCQLEVVWAINVYLGIICMEVMIGILGMNQLKVWRENYLEQYLEEYMLVSVEDGETAKENQS